MIFPSQSANPENFVPSQSLIDAYPPGTLFATSSTGSANRRTLDTLIDNIIDTLGDVEDKPGKRIVLKLDGGPALPKGDPEWLEKQRQRGVVIFPGLPNGSAFNQASGRSLLDYADAHSVC